MLSRCAILALVCGSLAGCDDPPPVGDDPPPVDDGAPPGDDAGPGADAAAELGCDFAPPTACPSPAPTYDDVAPIFEERCVPCHGETPGYWPLDTYGHVADWQAEIRALVLDCSMPPPQSGVSMLADERVSILTWIRCGLPE